MGGKSKAPKAPDYAAAATAQGVANKETAIANNAMNRVDQITPDGSKTWTMKPGADPNNPKVGDYVETITDSPEQAAIRDYNNQLSTSLLQIGGQQLGRVGRGFSGDLNTSGMTPMRDSRGGPSQSVQRGMAAAAPTAAPVHGGQFDSDSRAYAGGSATFDETGGYGTSGALPLSAGALPGSQQGMSIAPNIATGQRRATSIYDFSGNMSPTGPQGGAGGGPVGGGGGGMGPGPAPGGGPFSVGGSAGDGAGSYGGGGFGTSGVAGPVNDASRQRVEAALLSRTEPQFQRDEQGLRTQLLNSGVEVGTEAYNRELDRLSRARNDSRMQAVLAGGQEESRQTQLNAGLQQQGFNQGLAGSQFDNQSRAQQLSEEAYLRSLPLNELNALRTGNQVSAPQFSGYYTNSAAPAPIFDAAQATGNYNIAATNAANSGSGGFFGGLAQLGAAGIRQWG